MLKTGCILKTYSHDTVISIMSRHTLNDGNTLHPQINENSYDEHIVVLAPPPKLIGDYRLRELPWGQFKERYIKYLQKPDIAEEIQKLAKRAMASDIRIVCIEEIPEQCHRKILAEECTKYEPQLEIEIE